jgi:hypothetical protein
LAGPIENTARDARLAGAFAKGAGPTVILGIVVVALVVLLILQAVAFKDRWTATDQSTFSTEVIVPIIQTQKDLASLLVEHERLPAHREATQWREEALQRNIEIISRLDRIEAKINRLK